MLYKHPIALFGFLVSFASEGFAASNHNDHIAAGVIARDDSQSGYYAITGVSTGRNDQTGARPFRRNILDLQKDGPSWSLYIQALAAMQNANYSDPLSYFQIAGIHGRPYVPWNNFNPAQGSEPGLGAFGGYCTHNSILFPTWHRPYLALVEQIIAGHAQDIAKGYSGPLSSIYQAAADNLRLPYWDWAALPQMPDIVSEETVTITTANGDQAVDNPLFTYKFNPSQNTVGGFMANSPQTVRDTTANVNTNLANGNLMMRTWLAMVKSTNYNTFATSATNGASLESVHNAIHSAVGGQSGHMTYLDYSAFDPMFWLHHTNVDRLFALWQAAFPNTYMSTPYPDQGTYTITPNSMDNVATSLTPFTSSTLGQPYDSASARYTNYFDYAYPEIEDWHQTTQQLKVNCTQQIYNLYDPNSIFGKRHDHRHKPVPVPALQKRKQLSPGAQSKEWSISLSVNKFDLDGAEFALRFFVGDIPLNPQDWANSCAGSVQIMPPPLMGNGPYPEIIEYDELSLDDEVAAAGYDPEDIHGIGRYLGENLQWRVQKLDGTVVPTEQLKSLSVAVQDETVTFPLDNTEFPTYGKKNLHPDSTKGKVGGSAQSS